MDKNKSQKAYRSRNGNYSCKKYEKTIPGYLMRMYRNMQSRVEGIQWRKAHLYMGKELLPREDFYNWAKNNEDFKRLFATYEKSGYDRMLAPSVNRIDSSIGYTLSNMEIITHSENSRRIVHSTRPVIQIGKDGKKIKEWDSLTEAAKSFGRYNPGNIVNSCKNGGIAWGYKWEYKDNGKVK